jgi:hypothetical protein
LFWGVREVTENSRRIAFVGVVCLADRDTKLIMVFR